MNDLRLVYDVAARTAGFLIVPSLIVGTMLLLGWLSHRRTLRSVCYRSHSTVRTFHPGPYDWNED